MSPNFGDMLKPLAGKIAVLVESKSERTPSGLHIPLETARSIHEEKATQGEVVAVGEECDEVAVGDIVIFGKYTGTKLRYKRPLEEGATDSDMIAWNKAEHETVIIMEERSVLTILLKPDEAKNIKARG